MLKTSEEQLSTDDFTNLCRRLDEIQKLEETKFSKKRDAKFKSDGIKPKTPIDSTQDSGEEDAYKTLKKENENESRE